MQNVAQLKPLKRVVLVHFSSANVSTTGIGCAAARLTTMKASLSPSSPAALPTTQSRNINKKYANSTACGFIHTNRYNRLLMQKNQQLMMTTTTTTTRVAAVTPQDPDQVVITWQVIVGAIAGVTPFIVAGIEFSKRIVAQRKCQVCGGSGLVLRDDGTYFRCPGCGGFLPWQSWKRFFTG